MYFGGVIFSGVTIVFIVFENEIQESENRQKNQCGYLLIFFYVDLCDM